jgi:hypothetical protein
MSIIIHIDDPEIEKYGREFNARDPAEAKQILIDDLKYDPFLWGKRLLEIVGRDRVEYKVSEVKK